MKLNVRILMLLTATAAPFAVRALTLVAPTECATVETHGTHLKAFEALTPAQRESTAYLGTVNTTWRQEAEAAYNVNSLPITLSWSGASGSATVVVTCDATGKVVFEKTTSAQSVQLPNYEIGRNYTWTVSDASARVTGHFYVARSAPRIIPLALGHVSAARDCGGWKAESGKVVRQGRVFRSAAFDWVYDDATVLAEFKDYWNNVVGLKTEIDLREEKYWKMFQTTYGWTGSTFGPSVRLWCSQTELGSDYKSGSYKSALTSANMRTAMKGALLLFADEANYPILFHCSQGRDRTGTLAFVLNGLLGVSLADLQLDYAYTDYSKDEYAGPNASNGWIMSLSDQLKTSYPDATYPTLQEKCTAYAKTCGLTAANIASIKANLLEAAETASGVAPIEEDAFVYTEYYWMRTGIGSVWADDKTYWYKDPSGKAKWSPANCVSNDRAAVYIWSNEAFPNSYPATGEFHIGKLVTHNEGPGRCGFGNSPKGYFTNSGHSVTDRALWTHTCGVAGAERFRMWLEGDGLGHVDVLANARLNLSAFETKTDNIYLNFPAGNCDGATVCFYDMNGSQTKSTFGWFAGGQANTTQSLIVSNALLSVTSTSRASGVAGRLALAFVLGDNNTTASAAMMNVSKSLAINSGSTLTVDAGEKAVGTYRLLSAGTLNCDSAFSASATVTGLASGTTGTVVKSGNAINLVVAEAGVDPEPEPTPSTAFDAAHTIVCYGDSLTWGTAAAEITMDARANYFEGRLSGVAEMPQSYPYWLSGLVPSNYNVIHQARPGSQTCNITSWSGDQTVKVKSAFTLPAVGSVSLCKSLVFGSDCSYGESGGWAKGEPDDEDVQNRWYGFVTPILPLDESYDAPKTRYSITGTLGGRHVRLQGLHPTNITVTVFGEGTATTVAAGSEFVPDNELLSPYKDAIRIICTGANDGNSHYSEEIKPHLQAFAARGGKYLIVSPSVNTGTASGTSPTTTEQDLANTFGDNYLNLRLKMVVEGRATATALGVPFTGNWDATDGTGLKAVGDSTHFSEKGYKVMAEFIRQKLVALGYVAGSEPHVHNWGEWTVLTDATKTANGQAKRTCADCNEVEECVLPKRWDYLETDESGYLGTGYVPNLKTTEVVFDVRFPDGTSANGGNALCCANAYVAYLIGERTDWPSDYGNALNFSHDRAKVDYYNCPRLIDLSASCAPAIPAISDTANRHAISFCGNRAVVDGTTYTGAQAATDVQASSSLMLFASKQKVQSQTNYGKMRKFVYAVMIKENDEPVRSYRPALDENGKATLFDDVTKTYARAFDADGFKAVNECVSPDPDPLALTAPAANATDVAVVRSGQAAFFALDRDARWARVDDKTAREAMVEESSFPQDVAFRWQGGTAPYTFALTRIRDGKAVRTIEALADTTVSVCNLETGRAYTWTVTDAGGKSQSGTFTTAYADQRFLRVAATAAYNAVRGFSSAKSADAHNGYLPNFRDVGGLFTADGAKRVKQGVAFRSFQFDLAGTSLGVDTDAIVAGLGVKTDLDLRNADEVKNLSQSPLGDGVAWVNCQMLPYDVANLIATKDAVATALRVFADASKLPAVFHCSAGQDRTGTLAMLLGAILDLDEEDIEKGWSASCFFQNGMDQVDAQGQVTDAGFQTHRVKRFFGDCAKYGQPSDTFAACVRNMLKAEIGLTDGDFEAIRANLLEDDADVTRPVKATVDTPDPNAVARTYDGTAQTTYLRTNPRYTVAMTTEAVDPGDYPVTLKLVDPGVCAWADGTVGDKTVSFTIGGEKPEDDGPTPGCNASTGELTFSNGVVYAYMNDKTYTPSKAIFEPNAAIVANGVNVSVDKVYLQGAGNAFTAGGTGSSVTLAPYQAATVAANTAVSFTADGGSVIVDPVNHQYGDSNYWKFNQSGMTLSLEARNSGYLGLAGISVSKGKVLADLDESSVKFNDFNCGTDGSVITLGNSTLKTNWSIVMGTADTTIALSGAAPFVQGANGPLTLGAKLTVKLVPELDWPSNQGRFHSIGKGSNTKITLASGVKFDVDVSEFAGLTTNVTFCLLSAPNTPAARAITLPNATAVTIRGEGAENCTVAFTKSDDDRYVYVTVTSAGRHYPDWIAAEDEAVKAKFDAWASAHGVTDRQGADEAAYLLNCDADEAAVRAAIDAFRIPVITLAADGTLTVGRPRHPQAPEVDFNGKVEIRGDAQVGGSYLLPGESKDARFFKAFLLHQK